jgi:histidine triad (HIT) family protein
MLFRAVWKVNKAVLEAMGADATTIGVNNGPAAGQVVPHVHVHVVPRRRGDGSGTIHSIFRSPPRPSESRMREIADKIRSRL